MFSLLLRGQLRTTGFTTIDEETQALPTFHPSQKLSRSPQTLIIAISITCLVFAMLAHFVVCSLIFCMYVVHGNGFILW